MKHRNTIGLVLISLIAICFSSCGGGSDVPSSSVTSSAVSSISTGEAQTCAIIRGGVKCWGDNEFGQLGDGTVTERHTPVGVSGLTSGVAAIALGEAHACALINSGGVKCWGDNEFGQLGDGTVTERHAPVDVSGLTSGVAAIALGEAHACALTTSGGVKCWGDNEFGQLGDGTVTERHAPVDVSGLTSGVTGIFLGEAHTCAITTSSGVKCWGDNEFGQLGDGTATESHAPIDVSGLTSGVAAIALGEAHTCALTISGGVKCWGDNEFGQLGDGTATERHTPVDVSGLTSGVTGIALGEAHACALINGGGVKCWGDNEFGQLGDGTATERHTPVDVSGLTGVIEIARQQSGN